MLTIGAEYKIHLNDIKIYHRIFNNIIGSLGFSLMLLFSLLFLLDEHSKERFTLLELIFYSLFILAIGIFSIYLIYKSYFIKDKPICIGSKGIIDEDENIYPWDKIEYAFVRRISKTNYLYVYYKDADNKIVCQKIGLSDYDVCENEIVDSIESWSGRDIGHYEDYLRDEFIKQQVEKGEVTESHSKEMSEKLTLYTPYFQKCKKEFMMYIVWLMPVLFIAYFISSILIDVKTPFDKNVLFEDVKVISLKFGCLFVYFMVVGLVLDFKTKKLRQNPDLKDLSKSELDKLLEMFDLKESSPIAFIFFAVPCVIWLLFAVYSSLYFFELL